MKIQYLGTGAAEATPAMFCQCRVCKAAFELGGKNIRTRSQTLVDDKILIDLPADTYMHFISNKINPQNIKTCIITHNHGDHLYSREMTMRRSGFADIEDAAPINYYATNSAYCELTQMYNEKMSDKTENENRVKIHKIYPFTSFMSDGYKITPLKANHAPGTDPVIYVIEKNNKTLLYGHDTGRFPDETWQYLIDMKLRFNMVSLDSTYSTMNGNDFGGHMNLTINNEVKNKMVSLGMADAFTVFVANHFFHRCGLYEEIKAGAEEIGFLASYDGMVIEF